MQKIFHKTGAYQRNEQKTAAYQGAKILDVSSASLTTKASTASPKLLENETKLRLETYY